MTQGNTSRKGIGKAARSASRERVLATMRSRRLAIPARAVKIKWQDLEPLAMMAFTREAEGAVAEAVVGFLLPEKKRSLKTLIDILKSFGVILGIVVVAEYFNGRVPRAFRGVIVPGMPSEVAFTVAQGAEYFAAVLFVLVVLQTLGYIWRPLAIIPVKWIVRLSTRAFPEVQPTRWKRLAVSGLDGVVNSLTFLLLAGVIVLLVHLARLGEGADEDSPPDKGAPLALKLDLGS